MKNETISRLILVLEIAAIILFHSLKSNPPASDKIVRNINEPNPVTLQPTTHFVLTSTK
ncbi:MAG: hypothetical protein H7122_03170 [Chitinophagaceae bacterium]|nr:hypothetical protein [Chitinophagaceae bacterium]